LSTSAAVNEAKRLDEIKFPEFTVKLITDVFDGLIAANIRQTESYVELLKATSQNVTEFVNNTKDDIDGEMILQYLSGIISDPAKVAVNSSLTTEEAKAVTDAIAEVPGDKVTVSAGTISQSIYEQILEAIAKRIAMDKYTMLKEMVKLGILRLVVETGVIETKLTFKTYGNNYYYNNASRYNRSSTTRSAGARTGLFTSLWCKAAAATRTTSIGISTASNTSTSSSGSSVEIFGRVQINFKTDYQPLLSTTT
jgi:hypothetical protein